ncbi:MAG: uridine kinase [Bacilli bacterium]|nr:uridine kinase [Erysipelotrichaceae bacterium]MDD6250211.1 uridine kinase [Bacillales bacterium]MDY6142459.1 uridine kinase [Bacilli bacterium]
MKRPIIIAVAGGSASGKTTVVNEIKEALEGEDIIIIKHDDYYKDQSHLSLEERKKTNYDHPSSLENDLLIEHLNSLIDGKAINKPIYDFVIQSRSDKYDLIEPAKVIILDGILVLEDERIRSLSDIKIFVECDEDIRLIRRIRRDMIERGREFNGIIDQYLSTVKPMYHLFVSPTKRYADIIVPNDYGHKVASDMIIQKIKSILNEK